MTKYARIYDVLQPAEVDLFVVDDVLCRYAVANETVGVFESDTPEAIVDYRRKPRPEHIRVFRYLQDEAFHAYKSHSSPPLGLDFVRGLDRGLHKKVTRIEKGNIRERKYYADIVDGSPVLPVVCESMEYGIESGNFVSRTRVLQWYRENGSLHHVSKRSTKYYSPHESIEAGIRQRKNIVTELKGATIGILAQAMPNSTIEDVMALGKAFVIDYEAEIRLYIEASAQDIHAKLAADSTAPFLDNLLSPGVTVRDYFMGEIDIWGLSA